MTEVLYTRRYRLLNPATGEVKLACGHEARKLCRYGWRKASLEEWFAYQCASIDYNAKAKQGLVVRH